MTNKTYQTRVQSKIDTSENWAKATNFIPLKGEICIYSDLHRMKVGDGTSKIGDLDFEKSVWYTSFTTESPNGNQRTATFTNTAEEIYTAHNSGFEVKAIWTNGNGVAVNTGAIFDLLNTSSSAAVFSKITPSNDEPITDYHIVMCASEGSMLLTYSLPNTYSNRLLPVTSTEDNDKILKVVNGAWAASALDKSHFVINFTLSEDKATATADKTTAEINNAYENGQTVVGLLTIGLIAYILQFNGISIGGPIFSTAMATSGGDIAQIVTLDYDEITEKYTVTDEKIESFTDTEIETFYNA